VVQLVLPDARYYWFGGKLVLLEHKEYKVREQLNY
jgi:hypothetical protein